jgi:hypothetical protein
MEVLASAEQAMSVSQIVQAVLPAMNRSRVQTKVPSGQSSMRSSRRCGKVTADAKHHIGILKAELARRQGMKIAE